MLLNLLVLTSLAFVAFIVLLSLYLSKPESMKSIALASAIPYYIALIITIGFFIYISPGLLDKINGIPKYQVVITGVYLLIALIFPILYFVAVFNKATPT